VIYDICSIVVTPFPFTDKKVAKKRPALIISEPEYQAHTGHATMLMITSAKHNKWHGDWEIKNLEIAGLPAPSIVRQKIFTLDLRLVIRQIGCLATEDQWHISKFFNNHYKGLLERALAQTNFTVHEPITNYETSKNS
jgi:mRNA interferase MazF